jgi:hypothetical protein
VPLPLRLVGGIPTTSAAMPHQLISDGHQPVGTICWDDETGPYEASVFFIPFDIGDFATKTEAIVAGAQAQRLPERLGLTGARGYPWLGHSVPDAAPICTNAGCRGCKRPFVALLPARVLFRFGVRVPTNGSPQRCGFDAAVCDGRAKIRGARRARDSRSPTPVEGAVARRPRCSASPHT